MNPALIIALIGIVIGPVVTYLVAFRRLSGKITTSAAQELWEESRSIRQDLTRRNEYLRGVIDGCEAKINLLEERINILEERNEALYLENGNLKRMIEEHEKTIDELRNQIHGLSDENKKLRAENIKLRARVTELEVEQNGRT